MTIPIAINMLLWSSIAFWMVIWTPSAIYVLLLYYKHRHEQAIRARHYQMVIIIGCIFIYAFFIVQPIALIDDSNYFLNASILHTIHYISFPIQIHGVKLALVLRYFAIYFDLNFAISMSDSKWKSIINTNFDNDNWFLKHKKSYGNFSWQLKTYFIGWLILSIVSTIIRNIYQFNVYSESVASILHGIIIFSYAPILIYLYFKMPNINNLFYIQLEIKYITIIFISQFVVYFISILLKQFLNLNDFILQCIWSYSGMIAVSLYLYFFTIWTLNKCVWNIDNTMSNECVSELIYLNTVNSLSYNSSNQISNQSQIELPNALPKLQKNNTMNSETNNFHEIDLFQVLANSNGYQYFMAHLMHEISYECLISFTEMCQFKIAMKDILTNYLYVHSLPVGTGNSKTIKDILLFEFSDIVPLSSIVYGHGDEFMEECKDEIQKKEIINQFKQKAYDLFIKYIYDPSTTCVYEINISYSMRYELIKQLRHYNDWMDNDINERELFAIYDECIIEMYDLMHDSLVRFKKTGAFMKLCQEINGRK